MKKIEISKEQILIEFAKQYLKKTSIASNLGISAPTLRKLIKEYGIEDMYTFNREVHGKDVACDTTFFNSIDTEEKAYVLGFFLADGWITSSGKELGFTVTETDSDILYKIKDVMNVTREVYAPTTTGYRSKPKKALVIGSRQIVKSLISLGVTSNKSFDAAIPFASIPDQLIPDLLRGLFDGDGSFNKNRPCIASNSLRLVEGIQEWITNHYGVSPTVSAQQRENGTITYRIFFNKNLFQLLVDMYKINTISLQRKQEEFSHYYSFRLKNI